jgi:hypothetical protein
MKKKVQISSQKAKEVVDKILTPSTEGIREHLTDDLFLDYLTGNLLEEKQQAVFDHLEICNSCAARLERLLVQARAWTGNAGQQRLAQIRDQILPTTLNNLTHNYSLLERLEQELTKLILKPVFLTTPGYVYAATAVEQEGQTMNGTLQWYYGEDEQGNLDIRLSSFYTELQGTYVAVKIGTWKRVATLEKVTTDQVGAEVIIERSEIVELPWEEGISFELTGLL